MPETVRYYKKKTGYRKKKMVMKRTKKSKGLVRYKNLNSHFFVRTQRFVHSLATGVSGISTRGIIAVLNNLPNVAEFTAMYDAYRIQKAVIGLTYKPNLELPNNLVDRVPAIKLYYKRDYDDITSSTFSTMLQSSQCKQWVLNPDRTKYISFKPCIKNVVNDGTNNISAGYIFSPRLNLTNPAVDHHGVKLLFNWTEIFNSASPPVEFSPGVVEMTITMYVQMINPR